MAKLVIAATVPDTMLGEWLQHLRDFDAAHPGCHFSLVADAPELSLSEVEAVIDIDPPFAQRLVLKRKPT
jgi:hypothetical protein